MSDDLDFEMDVVEDDELDELGADGVSSSDVHPTSQAGREGEEATEEGGSKMEVKGTEERGPSNSGKSSDRKKKALRRSTKKHITDPEATQLERDAFGSLPSGWEYGRTGEWLQYIRSGISESQNQDGEGIPVTRIETISDGTVDYEKVGYVDLEPKEAKADRLKSGDLLFSNINSREEIGKTAVYKGERTLYHGMNLLRLRYVDDVLQPLFAYYLYDSPMAKDIFFRLAQAAVGQSSINQGQIKNLSLPRPPLPEQRKIASVLLAVDQAIQKTEAIIEQAKRVKRGLMQRLFHHGLEETNDYQTTKYGSAPAHWEIKPISDLAIQVQAGGTPDTDREEFYDGKIPWIRTGELRQKRIRDPEKSITEAGFENSTARLFPKDTVLVAMYGATAGESAMLDVEATSNQACCGVITDEEKILPEFLFQQLLYLKENLIALGAGSGQQNISKGIISNFRVLVPQLDEQTEIASILRIWDEEVEAGEKKREQLKRLKKGLMQDLLTGEVRTADKAVEVLDEVAGHG